MNDVFQSLRSIFKEHEPELLVVNDSETEYYLNSKVTEQGKPVFVGMVKATKAKVSFHLMPVYCHPELLDGLSPDLKKRMQGKSCFNFTQIDIGLFEELAQLTRQGLATFRNEGRI